MSVATGPKPDIAVQLQAQVQVGLEPLLSNSVEVGPGRAKRAIGTAFTSLASVEQLPNVGIASALLLPGLMIGSLRRIRPQSGGRVSEPLERVLQLMQQHHDLSKSESSTRRPRQHFTEIDRNKTRSSEYLTDRPVRLNASYGGAFLRPTLVDTHGSQVHSLLYLTVVLRLEF